MRRLSALQKAFILKGGWLSDESIVSPTNLKAKLQQKAEGVADALGENQQQEEEVVGAGGGLEI